MRFAIERWCNWLIIKFRFFQASSSIRPQTHLSSTSRGAITLRPCHGVDRSWAIEMCRRTFLTRANHGRQIGRKRRLCRQASIRCRYQRFVLKPINWKAIRLFICSIKIINVVHFFSFKGISFWSYRINGGQNVASPKLENRRLQWTGEIHRAITPRQIHSRMPASDDEDETTVGHSRTNKRRANTAQNEIDIDRLHFCHYHCMQPFSVILIFLYRK